MNVIKRAFIIFIVIETVQGILFINHLISYLNLVSLALGFIAGAMNHALLLLSIDTILYWRMKKTKSFAFLNTFIRLAIYGVVFYISLVSPLLNLWIVLGGFMIIRVAFYLDVILKKEVDE